MLSNTRYIITAFVLALSSLVHNTDVRSTQNASLDDDPSLFPGHMEPLGAKQPKADIETLTEYPSPQGTFLPFNQT